MTIIDHCYNLVEDLLSADADHVEIVDAVISEIIELSQSPRLVDQLTLIQRGEE